MSEDEKDGKSDKSDKSDKSNKPSFVSRFVAYIIDTFIVLLLSSLLATPFVNSKNMEEVADEAVKILSKYQKDEVSDQEYLVEISNINYKMARTTLLVSIMTILISVVYFVVVPLYQKGQTFGKKFMKIRVSSIDGELTANQLIFRSFLANAILLNIISVLFCMFASRDVYSGCVEIFSFTQHIIVIVSVFTIIFGKEGFAIHDMLTHTKVVKTK